jgi:hypothetical protein
MSRLGSQKLAVFLCKFSDNSNATRFCKSLKHSIQEVRREIRSNFGTSHGISRKTMAGRAVAPSRVLLRLKSSYKDSTTHIVIDGLNRQIEPGFRIQSTVKSPV